MIILLQESVPWVGFKWQGSVVFYSLIGLLLILTVVVIWKYLELNGARNATIEYVPKVARALKDMNWDEALNITTRYSDNAPLAKIVLAGLKERERLKDRQLSEPPIKHMNQAMEREIIKLQRHYRAGLGFVDAMGGTLPFIGALSGSPSTFAFGTFLAIPTIWLATYFRNKVLSLEGEMRLATSELVSYVEDQFSLGRLRQ